MWRIVNNIIRIVLQFKKYSNLTPTAPPSPSGIRNSDNRDPNNPQNQGYINQKAQKPEGIKYDITHSSLDGHARTYIISSIRPRLNALIGTVEKPGKQGALQAKQANEEECRIVVRALACTSARNPDDKALYTLSDTIVPVVRFRAYEMEILWKHLPRNNEQLDAGFMNLGRSFCQALMARDAIIGAAC